MLAECRASPGYLLPLMFSTHIRTHISTHIRTFPAQFQDATFSQHAQQHAQQQAQQQARQQVQQVQQQAQQQVQQAPRQQLLESHPVLEHPMQGVWRDPRSMLSAQADELAEAADAAWNRSQQRDEQRLQIELLAGSQWKAQQLLSQQPPQLQSKVQHCADQLQQRQMRRLLPENAASSAGGTPSEPAAAEVDSRAVPPAAVTQEAGAPASAQPTEAAAAPAGPLGQVRDLALRAAEDPQETRQLIKTAWVSAGCGMVEVSVGPHGRASSQRACTLHDYVPALCRLPACVPSAGPCSTRLYPGNAQLPPPACTGARHGLPTWAAVRAAGCGARCQRAASRRPARAAPGRHAAAARVAAPSAAACCQTASRCTTAGWARGLYGMPARAGVLAEGEHAAHGSCEGACADQHKGSI